MKKIFTFLFRLKYRFILRPIFFLFDSEKIHNFLVACGNILGRVAFMRWIIGLFLRVENKMLEQEIAGVFFKNPIGLSAGFDYDAKLTKILPALSFGFGTVGTITNKPYEGNPEPRLGRLPKSKSLLVNKGFKNNGIEHLIGKHRHSLFEIPIGLSLGKTNCAEPMTQGEAVADVVEAFTTAEKAKMNFSYYELNISCPNLRGNVEFYEPQHLRELLTAVCGLGLSKPVFIKMPIDKTDEETRAMLDLIAGFPIQGVIFGNLQRNRAHPTIDQAEASKYPKGNFSGKPTESRSNELIALAYKCHGERLVIIGSGGVSSPEDAYKKIRLGASLIQLITGLVYEGPQLVSEINQGLVKLLRRDGFSSVSKAVGADIAGV